MLPTELLSLAAGIVSIVGVIYRVAQVEHAIYKAIDAAKDISIDRLNALERRMDVHVQDYVNRKEHENYVFHALSEKIDHKFERLSSAQKEIQRYLQKRLEFQPKEYFSKRDDDSQ